MRCRRVCLRADKLARQCMHSKSRQGPWITHAAACDPGAPSGRRPWPGMNGWAAAAAHSASSTTPRSIGLARDAAGGGGGAPRPAHHPALRSTPRRAPHPSHPPSAAANRAASKSGNPVRGCMPGRDQRHATRGQAGCARGANQELPRGGPGTPPADRMRPRAVLPRCGEGYRRWKAGLGDGGGRRERSRSRRRGRGRGRGRASLVLRRAPGQLTTGVSKRVVPGQVGGWPAPARYPRPYWGRVPPASAGSGCPPAGGGPPSNLAAKLAGQPEVPGGACIHSASCSPGPWNLMQGVEPS